MSDMNASTTSCTRERVGCVCVCHDGHTAAAPRLEPPDSLLMHEAERRACGAVSTECVTVGSSGRHHTTFVQRPTLQLI